MRISDWSSDVCSSDLEADRIDKELERLPETLSSAGAKFSTALNVMIGEEDQALGFTTALAEGLAFLAANLSTVANVAIGAATALTEIGNASCRERVCQYV